VARAVAINTVPDAKVRLDQVGDGLTNKDGYYCWPEVSSSYSAQHIWVEADGYEPYSSHIELTSGANAVNQDIFIGHERWSGAQPTDINLPALVPVYVPPVIPPQPVGTIKGELRFGENGYVDDTGLVNVVLCHAGDLLSQWVRGNRDHVHAVLDTIAKAGYHGVRTWTVLDSFDHPYWKDYRFGPHVQPDYYDRTREFADALKSHGLRWLVSQGDMLRVYQTTSERQTFMRRLAEAIKDSGVTIAVDAGNEALWNGESDPTKLTAVADAFRAVIPCAVWSRTSAASEEKADVDATDGSIFDVHGYRDGHSYDKLRHIFSCGYDGQFRRRLGIQSEPFGPGPLVSVTANQHELNSDVEALAGCISIFSRQIWVYFCSPGIKSDLGERFIDMPGFKETPAAIAYLPKDVMAWPTLVHGGTSQQGRRVFAVPSTDATRADHALSNDGRFVCAMYGPRWRECTVERPHQAIVDVTFGNDGRLVVGRIL
jgi:hypothetical protein